jgi:hypothetical protein
VDGGCFVSLLIRDKRHYLCVIRFTCKESILLSTTASYLAESMIPYSFSQKTSGSFPPHTIVPWSIQDGSFKYLCPLLQQMTACVHHHVPKPRQ